MMARKSDIPTSKHTLHLREGDFEILMQEFPKKGASAVIRSIVATFVDKHFRRQADLTPDELAAITDEAKPNF